MRSLELLSLQGLKFTILLGRGGVLGQGKGSGSWVNKRLMGILAVTVYGSI